MENLLYFKSLLLKLTLFTFLVKTFRKYSLFRRVWVISNSIIMAIFGISVLDFYGISFIASFYSEFIYIIGNTITYLTSTHFYSVLSGLFGSKVEIEKPTNILRSNNQSSTRSEANNKVSDWFNRQEVIEEESNNKKYYIIAAILLLSCLTWYYYGDDIKPMVNTGINKIKSTIRKRPDNDGNSGNINPSNVNNDLHANSWSDSLWNIWDKIKNKVRRNDNTNIHSKIERSIKDKSIELIDNTQPIASTSQTKLDDSINIIDKYIDKNKSIDFNNLSQTELKRRGLLEPQLTGLIDITGDSFDKESGSVINEIYTFLNYHENSKFPKTSIQIGLASLLSDRLSKLVNNNNDKYYELLRYNPHYKAKIEKFTEVLNELIPIDSYNDVALETVKEQDVWSDKANTPSAHSQLLSPINNQNLSYLEKETEKQVLQDDLQAMSNLAVDNENILIKKLTTISQDELDKKDLTRESYTDQALEFSLAQLDNKASNEKYQIPKVKTKSKGIFSNWLDEIKSKRNDSDIIDGTNKESNIEVDQSKLESVKTNTTSNETSLFRNKDKVSAFLDKANKLDKDDSIGLNDQDLLDKVKEVVSEDIGLKLDTNQNTQLPDIVVNPESNSNSSMDQYFTKPEDTNVEPKSGFNALLDAIKSRRDDTNVVSSPKISQIGLNTSIEERLNTSPLLHKPSISNLFDDTANLFDDEDIEPNIKVDSPKEELTNIQETSENIVESTLGSVLETVKGLFTPKNENKNYWTFRRY